MASIFHLCTIISPPEILSLLSVFEILIFLSNFNMISCVIEKVLNSFELVSNLLKLSLSLIFNPLLPGVAFVYPPKTSENLRFLRSLKREHREVMCWKWESGNGFSIDFFVDYMPFLNPFPRTLFQKASTIFK